MANQIDTSPQSTVKMLDVIEAFNDLITESGDFVKKTGDTLEGQLKQPLVPVAGEDLANKEYVDEVTSGGAAQISRFEYTGTAGQTVLSGNDISGKPLAYTPDNLDVYVGGAILSKAGFTATDGTTITLATALTAGQKVKVMAFGIFAVANALAKRENLADLENPSIARTNIGLTATNTPMVPAGGLASTNVQAGLQELNNLKFDKTGGTLTGFLGLNSVGVNQFVTGNGDAINYTTYNVGLKLAKGLAFLNSGNDVKGFVDAANGVLDMAGDIRVNNQGVWHSGNFNPNSKLNVSGGSLTGNITITKSDASLTLVDSFNQYKIHTSNTSGSASIRYSFYDVNGVYIGTPLMFQSNGDIWSTAFGNGLLSAWTWNQGNFNPTSKANVSGQSFTGSTGVTAIDPYLFIERTNIRRWNFNITSDGSLRIMDGNTIKATIDTSGNISSTGNVGAYSDIKIKKDIKTIDGALEKVGDLRGVEYTRKDTGVRQIGVIAQEIQKVFPEVIVPTLDADGEEILTVSYGNITAVLIEAIKELNEKVKALEEELKSKG